MNLLIGIVILLCLVCSEIHPAEFATDLWTRICLVGLVSLAVPGLALFQTLVVSHRIRDQNIGYAQRASIIRRVSVCHSAVWLIASIAIIWAVRWQDVVRVNWNLDRWPLLDEMMLLAPVVFSLVASWLIFYENQRSISGTRTARLSLSNLKQRIEYVALRFQVYFLVALIPIAVTILARDATPWLATLSTPVQALVYSLSTLLLAAGFPLLLRLIWKNHTAPAWIRDALLSTCQQLKLRVDDIRIWDTHGRIVNAVVVGTLPWFRILMISDRLVETFPRNELLAVIRHEAGHLRLWHLPMRIAFTILPLFVLGIDQASHWNVIDRLEILASRLDLTPGTGTGLCIAVYVLYLGFGMRWLAHRMEFEADLDSCYSFERDGETCGGGKPILVASQIQDMVDALRRLASLTPSQFRKRTLLHPSICERIEYLRKIQECPSIANRQRVVFESQRRLGLGLLLAGIIFSTVVHFS